ncbi:MAG: formylglycine-generating enzyme family protein [Rhodopseudomonas palustris]|uniref:Formylglycine-generating enzyme family protein n=1 Tax=Rhodopseudomonas palustris TaxID=1076 RepID=A0A933RUT1_RHOPL|nr:formylglycine-generating enzyme family protein [Rhodopseudomonas palustris]
MAESRTGCCSKGRAGDTPAASRDAPSDVIMPSPEPVKRRWSAPLGGSFRMGSEDRRFADDGEGPVRSVTLSPFRIACYTVSNLQFGDFVRATGYTTDAERYGWSFVFEGLLSADRRGTLGRRVQETPWWLPIAHAYWAQPEGPDSSVLGRLDHPVVHVSWNDAKAYCRWSGTRLPSEAEWEFAARGGLDQATFAWGDELTPNGEHRCNIWQGRFPDLNTQDDGYLGTAPVHAFPPNGHGLYNVAGNVWEWCEDTFSPRYHQVTSPTDPRHSEPAPNRSMRGGSFLCHESYCNRYRVGARSSNTPDSSASNIGFRVVDGPLTGAPR